jgi:hypothetical protein
MFHGIERELLNGEPGLLGQQSQLLYNLQLFDQKHEIRNIWELPPQKFSHCERVLKQEIKHFGIFTKLKSFSLKAITDK